VLSNKTPEIKEDKVNRSGNAKDSLTKNFFKVALQETAYKIITE
jgi:hypothetical protein